MKNKSKLNTILLVIIIILLVVVLGYFFLRNLKERKDTNLMNNLPKKEDQVSILNNQKIKEQPTDESLQKTLIYSDNKFGITFSYNSLNGLKDINNTSSIKNFSIYTSGNGHQYSCPLPNTNNGMRIYSEEEVSENNINISGCNYIESDLKLVAEGQFKSHWSKDVYGTEKNIKDITINGHPAKLVYGSTETRTLIIQLTSPYVENGSKYDFLNLTADRPLMEDIITTLKFK